MQFNIDQINPAALHVMWMLDHAGYEGRICGGAVRDLMMCQEPKDWDIATTARPETVMAIMGKAGIQVIPTVLQHGTITAVIGNENIEITTLRVDVATDGRHAEVEFTTDWITDSLRRDFTINAMYLDVNLVVHDYHNGLDDLEERLIRFVGDARARIEEDYLRILRYFRFRARFYRPDPKDTEAYLINSKTMDVIRDLSPNLKSISGERIWAEITKIISVGKEQAVRSFKSMQSVGVLDAIELSDIDPAIMEKIPDMRPSVILASSVQGKSNKEKILRVLKHRYKVSRDEFAPIEFALKHADFQPTRINAVKMLGSHDKDAVLAWASIMEPRDNKTSGRYGVWGSGVMDGIVYSEIQGIVVPEFPITGQDIIDMGFTPGPDVGRILRQLRDVWAGVEFSASREYLINLIHLTKGHIQ